MGNDADQLDPFELKRLRQLMSFERKALSQGFRAIAGIDEAGRGPLAGPVVAAACILPRSTKIANINDSKKLTSAARAEIFEQLKNHPNIHFAVGIVDAEEIDRINIYQATIKAMLMAVTSLPIQPDCLLVDGMNLTGLTIPATKIVKGDQLSLSIAAASIIAKETRDLIMLKYHEMWPDYGFDQHKGYGTPKHKAALKKHGNCPIHRRSFKWQEEKGGHTEQLVLELSI